MGGYAHRIKRYPGLFSGVFPCGKIFSRMVASPPPARNSGRRLDWRGRGSVASNSHVHRAGMKKPPVPRWRRGLVVAGLVRRRA